MAVSVAAAVRLSGLDGNPKERLVTSHAAEIAQESALFQPVTTSLGEDDTNEDDFYRWRPGYHLMPNHNWANDPCGPGYCSATGYYFMSFQWNPYGWEWGNMSWGHAVSRDLVSWHVSKKPSIEPSQTEDPCGVFTGCT